MPVPLLMVLPLIFAKRTRVHSVGSCGAGVATPFAHPPMKWKVREFEPLRAATLNRGDPAPQCVPLRYSNPSTNTESTDGTPSPLAPRMVAPAAEQSAVGPFLLSSRPECGSENNSQDAVRQERER